jgi:hypothetical protein
MASLNLAEFLSIGSLVRTKHQEAFTWGLNIVVSIEGDEVEIDNNEDSDFAKSLTMTGDLIDIKHTTDSFEYLMTGWVSRVNAEYPQTLIIRINQIEKFLNTRASYRYDISINAKIRKEDEEKSYNSIITNISKTGAAIILHSPLSELYSMQDEDMRGIRIFVDAYVKPKETIKLEGFITWEKTNEKGYEYGLNFLDVKNRKALNDYISELEKAEKRAIECINDYINV